MYSLRSGELLATFPDLPDPTAICIGRPVAPQNVMWFEEADNEPQLCYIDLDEATPTIHAVLLGNHSVYRVTKTMAAFLTKRGIFLYSLRDGHGARLGRTADTYVHGGEAFSSAFFVVLPAPGKKATQQLLALTPDPPAAVPWPLKASAFPSVPSRVLTTGTDELRALSIEPAKGSNAHGPIVRSLAADTLGYVYYMLDQSSIDQ